MVLQIRLENGWIWYQYARVVGSLSLEEADAGQTGVHVFGQAMYKFNTKVRAAGSGIIRRECVSKLRDSKTGLEFQQQSTGFTLQQVGVLKLVVGAADWGSWGRT